MRVLIYGWFLLGSVLSHATDATQTEALLALSSLRYFVDRSEHAIPNAIQCTDTELTQLWEVASAHPLVADKVTKARHLYFTHSDPEHQSQLLTEAWQALKTDSSPIQVDLSSGVYRAPVPIKNHTGPYPQFDDNPFLTEEMRVRMKPFLLPLTHVSKPVLDKIFGARRVTQDEAALEQAGFKILFSQKVSYIKVISHPQLPRYLIKLYLDNDLRIKREQPGWKWLAQRPDSARQLQSLIKKHKIRQFVVPDKWIYPLPAHTSPPNTPEYVRQPVVLFVQRMPVVNSTETRKAWQTKIRKKHLHELYILISEGYETAYIAGNMPYCGHGKFAYVDTEYDKRPADYNKVRPYLSPKMNAYWDQLVRSGGRIQKKDKECQSCSAKLKTGE